MALTIDQYLDYLQTRDLPWPAAPAIQPVRARPHLVRLPDIRVITWNPYGTLLAIAGGELWFEHPQTFLMDLALEKTVQEFRMWKAMSRKPGQPSEYFRRIYLDVYHQQRMKWSGGERHPELSADAIWQALIKKLLQKDYQFDSGFYGALNEYSCKVAYFFHASLQGTACFPGAADALRMVAGRGLRQGLLGSGQCFTRAQLRKCLKEQGMSHQEASQVLDENLAGLSVEVGARPPSKTLFQYALTRCEEDGVKPEHVLHIGSRLALDIAPARRLGMRTALLAQDKDSMDASPELWGKEENRPDVLLTEPAQIAEVLC
jgi:FMN phosphatase YigB (HAD superfamily)